MDLLTTELTDDVIKEIVELSVATVGEERGVSVEALRVRRDRGAKAVLAYNSAKLTGCWLYSPMTSYGDVDKPKHRLEVARYGVRPEAVLLSGYIYVHPDHQGQGLTHDLRVARDAAAIADGYTHALIFGAATKQVMSWAMHTRQDAAPLPFSDWEGKPAYIVPLEGAS